MDSYPKPARRIRGEAKKSDCYTAAMSQSDIQVDVLIVGAGPSGSTAATALAKMGHSVAIIDKGIFPRHKTCASWVNALAFSRLNYLEAELPNLVDCPFYGIRFYNESMSRQGTYNERQPSGYLTLRSKFDHGLARLAVLSGATFLQNVAPRTSRKTGMAFGRNSATGKSSARSF